MTEFEKQIHNMFDHIWDCDIDHPIFEDTVGELMEAVIQCYKIFFSAEAERKKGKWTPGEAICPVCGENKFKDLDADIWADWTPNYCPNCGADMRGEQE